MKHLKALLTLLLTLATCMSGLAEGAPETEAETFFERHGALHVSGTGLADATGAPVQLRGVSTHGLAWFPEFVNEAAFRTIRDDWGANAVRLAMYTCEEGGYMTGGDRDALEALIDKGVNLCGTLGMYAIIDWHVLSDGNPNTHADAAEDFFRRMSARYAGRSHVLYELCNEPNGRGVNWPVVRDYAERIIPVIRANAPEAVIICGTPDWSQDVDAVAANPIDDANTIYALHFYAASHRIALRGRVKKALKAGVPVFVSEFGICDASGGGAIDVNSAAAWRELIEDNNLSYMAWSLSNADETAALIRADCPKTSDWTEDELSETGRWLRGMMREDGEKN